MGEMPKYFCWSKVGAEAGESVAEIVRRKESARVADGGVFLWGVGQSVGRGVGLTLERVAKPEALFTDMLSRPKPYDSAPSRTVLWTKAVGLDGKAFEMPPHSLVTSRDAGKTKHYALVCRSAEPIDSQRPGLTFSAGDVRNIERGTPVGGSQVTAAVEYVTGSHPAASRYHVRFRVELAHPYVLELAAPVAVPDEIRDRLRSGDLSVVSELGRRGGWV